MSNAQGSNQRSMVTPPFSKPEFCTSVVWSDLAWKLEHCATVRSDITVFHADNVITILRFCPRNHLLAKPGASGISQAFYSDMIKWPIFVLLVAMGLVGPIPMSNDELSKKA